MKDANRSDPCAPRRAACLPPDTTPPARARRAVILPLAAAVLAGVAVTGIAAADGSRDTYRYPYDPVCSWGRVADGRGMIVRCLTRAEAEALGASPGAARGAASSGPGAASASAAPPRLAASTSAAPDVAPPGAARPLVVEVGPVVVDTGALPLALGKLKAPADRYLACVRDHGGITREVGEIQVRFLVRERGRAEGAVVSKRAGVSEAAARCVADVVDRRLVGSPEAPMVGATLTVRVRESSP